MMKITMNLILRYKDYLIDEEKSEVTIEKYIRDSIRYSIKAGITGYAQVYGNYSSRASDKILLDLIYALNYSLLLDIKLILLTVRQVFIHESAEGHDEEFHSEMDRHERETIRRNNLKGDIYDNEKDLDYNSRL